MHRLTEPERRAYGEDGYFIRPTLFSAAEMDALSGRIEALAALIESADALTREQKDLILKRVRGAEKSADPASLNSLTRFHRFSASVRAHIRDPRRLAVATELVGPDLLCPNDLYFFKPPGTGKPVAWHQDSWYFSNSFVSGEGASIADVSLGTWLALDDADADNGCLWVIPGSHRLGVVDHCDVEGDDYFLQKRVAVTAEMEARAMPVEVPKGALVFFNNALLHRSTPNRSARFRRAYIVHYMRSTIRTTAQFENRKQPEAARHWGSQEAYICGRPNLGDVPTTPEAESLDWDRALGGALTADDLRGGRAVH